MTIKKSSDRDYKQSFGVSATYVNRVFLSPSGPFARLSFAEQIGTGPEIVFRTSIVISIDDLIELRNLINDSLKGAVPVQPMTKQ